MIIIRIRNLILDLDKRKYQKPLFKQYDNNIEFKIQLVDTGKPVSLEGCTVSAFFDNGTNVIQKNTTIKENVVTTILDNTILAKEGIVRAEFSIVKNDMVVTTFTILLEVEPSIDRNNAMTKQPEWDMLVDLRKELEEAIELTPNWLYGDNVPAKENGDRNDYYLKRGNGEVFHRDSKTDTWKSTNIFLKGCQWHYGKEATPIDTLGNNGDYYINTDNYDFFNKANGKWVKIGNIKGIDGNREILVQPEMPTDQQVGHIWIDTDS